MENPKFLNERFPGLAKSLEVEKASERSTIQTKKEVSKDPEARIQNYLNRLNEIVNCQDPEKKKSLVQNLKQILVEKYIVRLEDVPDSSWQAQMRVVRSRGESGDWQELSKNDILKEKQKYLNQTKEDQQGSLEEWVDYLTSSKSSYLPDYLKYWVFASMLKLERYKKGNKDENILGGFPKRPSGKERSIKMFPEVNERGLESISQAYTDQSQNNQIHFRYDIPDDAKPQFIQYLNQKDFRALYGWTQEHIPPISEEEMKTTNGRWAEYKQGSSPELLAKSLQGKGSGWCIAGKNIAGNYLSHHNLYVYYTRDENNHFIIPRVVIVKRENLVTEVRGIEWEENVDKYIKETNVISDKLKEISGGEAFFETDQDTKKLTAIEKKNLNSKPLIDNELTFLYEIDRPIKYFGYKKDPRIQEIRNQRNLKEDVSILFKCSQEQIAINLQEINSETKFYIGKLNAGIFDLIQKYGIEHVYASFPEGKIERGLLEIGGITKPKLIKQTKDQYQTNDYSRDMMNSEDLENPEPIDIIRLRVGDLFGDGKTHTTAEIMGSIDDKDENNNPAPFTKGIMTKLGLEFCPAEAGPYLRKKCQEVFNREQPMGEWLRIAMKPISDRDGGPGVFSLGRRENGLWRDHNWARPGAEWDPGDKFVFRLRKLET